MIRPEAKGEVGQEIFHALLGFVCRAAFGEINDVGGHSVISKITVFLYSISKGLVEQGGVFILDILWATQGYEADLRRGGSGGHG